MNNQMESEIESIITQALHPDYLKVENISHMHRVPANSETHFQVTVVAPQFQELNMVNRHRLLNTLLKNPLDKGVHALTMNLYTPDEWKVFGPNANPPPECAH